MTLLETLLSKDSGTIYTSPSDFRDDLWTDRSDELEWRALVEKWTSSGSRENKEELLLVLLKMADQLDELDIAWKTKPTTRFTGA